MAKIETGHSSTAYYLEPNSELAKLWCKFFDSKGVKLDEHKTWDYASVDEKNHDFFLLDGNTFFDSTEGSSQHNGLNKPVFILTDYFDETLLKNCLTFGVKDCFDKSTPLKEIYAKISDILKDRGSRDYTDEGFWLTWVEVKEKEGVSHMADLAVLKKFQLMEEVFIHEFFLAEGNMTTLAEENLGITRVTCKKYYNQFQRRIFYILIEELPGKEDIPFLRAERTNIIKAMKKQWLYDDFRGFLDMYDNDLEVVVRVLKVKVERIGLFCRYWKDLML